MLEVIKKFIDSVIAGLYELAPVYITIDETENCRKK